jgi:cytochrome c oxidase subunit 3
MGLGLASIAMLFIAMTSAYIVRHAGNDWQAIRMPQFLLFNTFLLLLSSYTMERARRACLQGQPGRLWLRITFLLGVLFVGGQILVWRQLSETGIYLGSNPHSSFFYLLTALHGLHLLGGIAVLGFLSLESSHQYGFAGAGQTAAGPVLRLDRWVDATALYWHFMDGLWLYLVVLLFVRR